MSAHPIDRLIAEASANVSRARVCVRYDERIQALASLERAETLLQIVAHARLVEAVARLADPASPSLPGQMRRGTIAA